MTSNKHKIEAKMARDLLVFRQDRTLLMVDGMFVPNGNGGNRKETKLQLKSGDITFKHGEMSWYEMKVLHAIAAMAQGQIRGEIASYDAADGRKAANDAWLLMGEKAREFGQFITVIRTSKRQLAEMAGTKGESGGKVLSRAYKALERLADVSIVIRSLDRKNTIMTPLVQVAIIDDLVSIALNPRLATALTGAPGQFSLLSSAARKIRSEASGLLYCRLCGYVDEGATRYIGQDRMENHIWGDVLPADQVTPRKSRRKYILKALEDMRAIGWLIEEICAARGGRPTFKVTRPKSKSKSGQIAMPLTPTAISAQDSGDGGGQA